MNNDYFERECAVCHKNYLTDGGDGVCGDVVCETIFERSTALREAKAQVETAHMNAQREQYATEMGV